MASNAKSGSHMGAIDPASLLTALFAALPVIVGDIERLVSCESPSADPEAIRRSAALVAEIGTTHLGVRPELLDIEGCVHVRWRLGEGPRRVLLLGHHDTVWPVGSLLEFPATTVDGITRGPGCLDMKAGIVIAFHALAASLDVNGVTLLVTGDEEVGAPTSRHLIEAEAADCQAVLVLEPATAEGALKLERKGDSHYEIAITGRAAHAGLEPERGVNALVELAHHVATVGDIADPSAGTTVTPTLALGGTATNTVPGFASLAIDVRARTRAEQERVEAQLRGLKPRLSGACIEVTGGINAPPLEGTASRALFELAHDIGPNIGLDDLRGVSVGGSSDGNLTAAVGIPTLDGLGATGDGIHSPQEHVIVRELPNRIALVVLLIDRLLRTGTGLARSVADEAREP
jgi:glutamate carboxypeptidase